MKKENKIKGAIELDEKFKTNSIYMGINIAHLRYEQLKRGANSRLIDDSLKYKNTSIAVEEVKRGLVAFNFGEPVV